MRPTAADRAVVAAAVIAAIVASACTQLIDDRQALALRFAGADPVALAELVAERSRKGCGGVSETLAALDAAAFAAELLEAMVESALESGRESCAELAIAVSGDDDASRLARSLLAPNPRHALDALAGGRRAAVHFRRAALLAGAGDRPAEVAELRRGLALEANDAARVRLVRALLAVGDNGAAALAAATLPASEPGRAARIAAMAAAGRGVELARAIAEAPLPERFDLAKEAVAAAADPIEMASADVPAELLLAAGERAAADGKHREAADLLSRASAARPRDADVLASLANALAAAGRLDEALAAWDRARAINPATPSLTIDPIAALAKAARLPEAKRRARAFAAEADDADEFEVGSAAAIAAGDPALALALAKRAASLRPGDGRLLFLLARRLDAAGDPSRALSRLAALFRCGARGHPWHRHEVAAAIVAIARRSALADFARAEIAKQHCEPAGLATFSSFAAELESELKKDSE